MDRLPAALDIGFTRKLIFRLQQTQFARTRYRFGAPLDL